MRCASAAGTSTFMSASPNGSGRRKRRSKTFFLSSRVGVTSKTRAAKGPAWYSSSERETSLMPLVRGLVASVGSQSLPTIEHPTVAGSFKEGGM